MDLKKMAEILKPIGNLAVVAGIVLVVLELNQNSKLVEAQLESDEFASWLAVDASKQSETFGEVLAKSIERPEELTLGEMVELDGYLYTYLDLLWRRETLHTLGIGSDLEVQARTSMTYYFGNRFAQAWWAESKFRFEDEFVTTIDRLMPEVSADQDIEFFGRIRTRLSAGD